VSAGPIDLPIFALSALAERERVGELHLVLQTEAVWRPASERQPAADAVRDALLTARLLDGRGRVDPDFLGWLPLLTTASMEYYAWYTVEGRTRGVLAASRGLDAVLAVRVDDWVRLAAIHRDRLLKAVVAELPEIVPGGGSQWSVALDELEEAGKPNGTSDRRLARHIAEVVKVVQRPVHGSGELYSARRDELGRRTCSEPVHYVDTDWGCYLNYTHGNGQHARFVLEPATPNTLSIAVEAMRVG